MGNLECLGDRMHVEGPGKRRGSFAAAVSIAIAVLFGAVFLASAASADTAKSSINTIGSKGIAIRGYDPVAYFRAGGPVKGKAQFAHAHGGATWQFSSAENKALFVANPDKYIPAYGGYCAYGVAKGGLYKIEPDAWSIRDGRLYLNYDRKVQKTWSKKPDSYIKTADRKWPGLTTK